MAKLERLPIREAVQKGRLVSLGGGAPREYPLGVRPAVIGGDPSSQIVIDDPTVSRRHATIAWRRGRFELTDLDSSNGTFVGERRVLGTLALTGGEEIRFGSARFVLMRSGGGAARKRLRPALLAMLVAAMFAAGFAGVRYRDVIAALMARIFPPAAPSPAPTSVPIRPIAAVLAATPTPTPPPAGPAPDWLKRLNYYRAMVKLAPVADDSALSKGDRLHAKYLVKNYRATIIGGALGPEMHTEDQASEWFTPDGLAAGMASDINVWFSSANPATASRAAPSRRPKSNAGWGAPEWSIDGWMAVPFHRLPMLSPGLASAGFGRYCEEGACAAGLNVESGVDRSLLEAAWPIQFPPDGAVIAMRSSGEEWPDPRAYCPGYETPSGLAITLMLGKSAGAHLVDFQVTRRYEGGAPANVEACGFDSSSYDNPDPEAQRAARRTLAEYGAIVVLPREPLWRGAAYEVSIAANGRRYEWSFSIAR